MGWFSNKRDFEFFGNHLKLSPEAYAYVKESFTLFKSGEHGRPCFIHNYIELFSPDAVEKLVSFLRSGTYHRYVAAFKENPQQESGTIVIILGFYFHPDEPTFISRIEAPFFPMLIAFLSLRDFNTNDPPDRKVIEEIDKLKQVTEAVEVLWLTALRSVWNNLDNVVQQRIVNIPDLFRSAPGYSGHWLAELMQTPDSLAKQAASAVTFLIAGKEVTVTVQEAHSLLRRVPDMQDTVNAAVKLLPELESSIDDCRVLAARLEIEDIEEKVKLAFSLQTTSDEGILLDRCREKITLAKAVQKELQKCVRVFSELGSQELQPLATQVLTLEQPFSEKLSELSNELAALQKEIDFLTNSRKR